MKEKSGTAMLRAVEGAVTVLLGRDENNLVMLLQVGGQLRLKTSVNL